jgi:hypothetical protein
MDVFMKTQFSFLPTEDISKIKRLGAHQLETSNFSRVARLKIGNFPLVGLIRSDV